MPKEPVEDKSLRNVTALPAQGTLEAVATAGQAE